MIYTSAELLRELDDCIAAVDNLGLAAEVQRDYGAALYSVELRARFAERKFVLAEALEQAKQSLDIQSQLQSALKLMAERVQGEKPPSGEKPS